MSTRSKSAGLHLAKNHISSVRPLFKNGLVTQGRFLVKMITLILSELNDDSRFSDSLYKLVVVHNKKGVKASEYGLVGEILFYTLRQCLGPAYTVQVSRVWIKVFSRMLRVIVPKAIALELATEGDNQDRRLSEYDDEEKKSEVLETERRQQLVGLSKEGACPFSHDSVKDNRENGKAAVGVTHDDLKDVPKEIGSGHSGRQEYQSIIGRKSRLDADGK